MSLLEELRDIPCGRKELRSFGLMMGVILAAIGGYLFWKGQVYGAGAFWIVAALFLLTGLLAPLLLKPIHKYWMALGLVLGWAMSHVVLFILFFLVLTPMGILGRIFGKKFLDLDWKTGRKSYWIHRQPSEMNKKRYERQF